MFQPRLSSLSSLSSNLEIFNSFCTYKRLSYEWALENFSARTCTFYPCSTLKLLTRRAYAGGRIFLLSDRENHHRAIDYAGGSHPPPSPRARKPLCEFICIFKGSSARARAYNTCLFLSPPAGAPTTTTTTTILAEL